MFPSKHGIIARMSTRARVHSLGMQLCHVMHNISSPAAHLLHPLESTMSMNPIMWMSSPAYSHRCERVKCFYSVQLAYICARPGASNDVFRCCRDRQPSSAGTHCSLSSAVPMIGSDCQSRPTCMEVLQIQNLNKFKQHVWFDILKR